MTVRHDLEKTSVRLSILLALRWTSESVSPDRPQAYRLRPQFVRHSIGTAPLQIASSGSEIRQVTIRAPLATYPAVPAQSSVTTSGSLKSGAITSRDKSSQFSAKVSQKEGRVPRESSCPG